MSLEVRGLSVAYQGVRALQGIDLRVAPGEIVALVGSNGAGKTSLLNAVMRLVECDAGSIHVHGQDVREMEPWDVCRLGVGYAPEGRRLFTGLTVRENIICGALHISKRARAEGVDYVLGIFPELKDRLAQPVETLSGGQQQMVAVARALVDRPPLVLLDELSLGLAPVLASRLLESVSELKAGNVSVLLVEQNVRRALEIASRGYVIVEGQITLQDASSVLLSGMDVEHAFLGL